MIWGGFRLGWPVKFHVPDCTRRLNSSFSVPDRGQGLGQAWCQGDLEVVSYDLGRFQVNVANQVPRARLHEEARFFIFCARQGPGERPGWGRGVIWEGLGMIWEGLGMLWEGLGLIWVGFKIRDGLGMP